MRSFSEISKLKTFRERFEYLKLEGSVGYSTFGFDRCLNQRFYTSSEWKSVRNFVILRDKGLDLGIEGYEIPGVIYVHHMNPIVLDTLRSNDPSILNPEYLICVSIRTHNAIHYGDDSFLDYEDFASRYKDDTKIWK